MINLRARLAARVREFWFFWMGVGGAIHDASGAREILTVTKSRAQRRASSSSGSDGQGRPGLFLVLNRAHTEVAQIIRVTARPDLFNVIMTRGNMTGYEAGYEASCRAFLED